MLIHWIALFVFVFSSSSSCEMVLDNDGNDDDRKSPKQVKPLECMIYNEEYKNEYLYALMGLNIARRSVYTWSPLVVKEFNPDLPEDCSNLFTENDKQVIIAFFVFKPILILMTSVVEGYLGFRTNYWRKHDVLY